MNKPTVGKIIDNQWSWIIGSEKFNRYQLRHLNAIRNCRTEVMGGHLYRCDDCGKLHKRYHSCRNRHCPNCQNTQRLRWEKKRKKELINVPYYHVVFTLPSVLNEYCLAYPREMYSLLFKCTWETLSDLGWHKKFISAQIGAVMVLHTWGQNMSFHPHMHCIVPGAGINVKGRWKTQKTKGKYLFPVKLMSKIFRGEFKDGLRDILSDHLSEERMSSLIRELYSKPWIVFCKPPFAGKKGLVSYLAAYTHQIAISNHRIIDVQNNLVNFHYRDYRNGGKRKVMSLTTKEFIRRFSLHLLPHGFTRIRHYGILSGRLKSKYLAQSIEQIKNLSWIELWEKKGINVFACPNCKSGRLQLIGDIPKRGPPHTFKKPKSI